MKKEKPDVSRDLLVGVGAAAVVVVVGLMAYFYRATDPAASGPVPYVKFDYGAHMQDQMRTFNRSASPKAVTSPVQGSQATTH